MIESWTGNPTPLLSCISVAPPTRVTSTLKAEMEVLECKEEENE